VNKSIWNRGISAGILILLVATTLLGCGTPSLGAGAVQADTIRSVKPRLEASPLDQPQSADLVEGNTAFALDLYRALFSQEENLFYSPHGLSVVFAMAYAGARGQTAQQMADALHFDLDQSQLHAAFNALDRALTRREDGASGEDFRLKMVNALWGQEGYTFLEPFLDTLAQYYGAGIQVVDFGQAQQALRQINRWVKAQTDGRIGDLLPAGSVDGETSLVLTNAIAFKAAWQSSFSPDHTEDGAFTLLNGEQIEVPMMVQVAPLGYALRSGMQAVELPYAGDALSMVVILPDAGSFGSTARSLDAASLDSILSELRTTSVRLTLPKFQIGTTFELRAALEELGMGDAFGDADFSGMDGTHELFIDEVYHQAQIDVDESGTEAAAASSVVMSRKGPAIEAELRIDRPFIFMICDRETGIILVLGQVVNPAQ
jgi:serpin B